MFYHELKSRTWIQRENKPYFILNIHELEVHLLQYGLQLEPYEYYFTPDDFPTDFEPLILPKFNVGDRVLYREITHNTLQNVERKMATIIHVDEDDELVKYAIRDNENNVPWALAIEVEPINY
jgi:hypothetical protein